MEQIGVHSAPSPVGSTASTPRQTGLLLRLTDLILSTTDLQVFCEELLEEIADVTHASAGVLFLANAGGAHTPFARVGPIAPEVVDALILPEGLVAAASGDDEVLVVRQGECDSYLPDQAGDDDPSFECTGMLALPLRSDERTSGALVLVTTMPGGFEDEAAQTLRLVGPSRLATAIGAISTVNAMVVEGERAQSRARAGRLLMSTADPQERLRLMAEQLARVAGVSRCLIGEVTANTQEIVTAIGAGQQEYEDMRRGLDGPIERLGLDRVIEAHRPTVLSNRDTLAGEAFAQAAGVVSLLVVPLVFGRETAGIAYLDEPGESTDFGELQIEAIESIADVAAVATHSVHIQRRFAEKAAMERHRDRLSALHFVLNQTRMVLDETALLSMLPRAVSDTLGYDRVYLYLVKDGVFEMPSCYFRRHEKDCEKFAARVRKNPPKMGQPTIEVEVYRHGNAQIVSDPSVDSRVIKQHQKILQSDSMAVVPLWGAAEVRGILVADCKYQGLDVSEEDIGLLSLLGTGVGAALENVRLYEAARRDRDKLATLLANSDDAIVILDRDRRIVAFNKTAERLSGVPAARAIGSTCQEVWTCCDEQGGELHARNCPVAARIAGGSGEHTTYSERVVRTADGREIDVASTFAYVEDSDGGIEQGMEILRDLTEHKRWMRDHHIADTLQAALLPEAPPADSGVDIGIFYKSATRQAAVGGDFYDFIRLSDGCLGIVIGDVCGKGIDAAHYTALTKFTLRAYVVEGASPVTVMARLNDAVAAQVQPGEFISMCFGVLDPGRRTFRYVNAGHPHPLLLHRAEGWRGLDKCGMVLGVVPGQSYEEETVELAASDTLLFYTDGLVETRRGPTVFGEERLMQFLTRCRVTSAQQFAERIYQRSATFSGGDLIDDVAVVVVRV